MIYLLGDSHAYEIASSYKLKNFQYKTLFGYGFLSFIGKSPRRNYPGDVLTRIENELRGLQKESKIIISYTDPDARIGMVDMITIDDLLIHYRNSITKMLELTSFKEMIILDWYGIHNRLVSEQTTTAEQRLKNRDMQLSVLTTLSDDFNIKVDTTRGNEDLEGDDGFVLFENFTRDGVHYNLSNESIKNVLLPKLKKYCDEE